MIKIKVLFISFLILSIDIFAQLSPFSYNLSEDGRYFSKINSGNPVSNSITDIITIGDTVWLGTSRGVSVSFDRGENWTNFYGTSPFGNDNISTIGYYHGTFWAATATTVEATGGQEVPAGTGLKYTTDNGITWTSIPQPVDAEDDTVEVYGINLLRALPVTVTEQNLTFDIAFTPGTVWITSFASGLRKSTDMGQTWQRVVLPPDFLNSVSPEDTLDFCLSPVPGTFCAEGNLNYRAFSIIAIDDTTLYAGTANGINKSTDNGISWVKFNHQNQDEPVSGNFITALGYNDFSNTVWAATWKAEEPDEYYGVSSSSNGGESWQTFLKDERTHNFGFKNYDVIAATDNGAFRSTNGGRSWILPNSIVDGSSGISLKTIVFYSADTEGNTVWLGSDDGLARLQETGLWKGPWKVYFASQPLKTENETYAYPNPFSPRQEQLKIKYSTGGKDASVTIRIYDFGMNYVRTLIQNAPRNRTLEGVPDFWDGKDDAGNVVPNGVYLYRVDVDSNQPLFGKIIVMQ
ncbi:BNR/Asp-box repeat protein [bacterium BMS3Abin03]|nr:BNR/Asp-box repeat protein [bacterium BMS3Abin03]